jgi:hypothetical protein
VGRRITSKAEYGMGGRTGLPGLFHRFHLRRKFFNECMDSLSALWWFAGLAGLYSPQTGGMHMVDGLAWWPGRHELVYFHVVI